MKNQRFAYSIDTRERIIYKKTKNNNQKYQFSLQYNYKKKENDYNNYYFQKYKKKSISLIFDVQYYKTMLNLINNKSALNLIFFICSYLVSVLTLNV